MLVNKTPEQKPKAWFRFNSNTQRAGIITLCIAIICLYFWIYSRYPDLDAKAVMSKSGTVSDLLSVWPIFVVNEHDHYFIKIMKSYVNWIMDNKKGMAFGLIIGGFVISLFKYIKFEKSKYSWVNSFYGILMGTPLGVCVNCAMPIFKGITQHRKIEMAFAMMISSPTLNIIIVSLAFSMFPFYLAAIKLGFSFFAVFVLVPIISKTIGEKKLTGPEDFLNNNSISAYGDCAITSTEYESWFSSIKQVAKDNYHSFKFILKTTVPLMFLAGFLGSFIIHSLDISALSTEGSPLRLAIISFLSLLIPVPVSFDVMLTHALYEGGMSIAYTSILLCNLGIFSIYAFFIIWTSGLRKWALALFFSMFMFSYLLGLFAPTLHERLYIAPNISAFQNIKSHKKIEPSLPNSEKSDALENLKPRGLNKVKLDIDHSQIEVFRKTFERVGTSFKQGTFIKLEGPTIGLSDGFQYAIRDYPDPFWIGRGSGAGDFNQDGWPDIAFGTSKGIALYQNINGYFHKVKLNQKIKALNVYAVAFIDLNNDSWLDLFFTTFNRGNFVLLNNQKGSFTDKLISVPNNQGIITLSPAFADFDQNGFLDIFNGNIALGVVTGSWKFIGKGRQNSLTYNFNLQFNEKPFPGHSGETMSTLASDINLDGKMDLYQAHDFIIPDQLHYDVNKFLEKPTTNKLNLIPFSPFFSMGADSGDLNNDGLLDLVLTGTTALSKDASSTRTQLLKQGVIQDFINNPCHLIKDQTSQNKCKQNQASWKKLNRTDFSNPQISDCEALNDEYEKDQCLLAMMWSLIISNKRHINCEQISFDEKLSEICHILEQKSSSLSKHELNKISPIRQKDTAFTYIQQKNGFVNINTLKPNSFIHPGGWTWNTKIADLDSDGFQDIINSEGAIRSQKTGWNTFMHNKEGLSFEEMQWSNNLTDPFSLFSFVLIDYDFDGDLDIIGNSSAGPIQVYKNETMNNSIGFLLHDFQGNRFGIGSKVYLKTAKGVQLREVKASGGYQSFDPPSIHFGLGESTSASELKVVWPNGEAHVMPGTWNAGYQYEIRRLPKG